MHYNAVYIGGVPEGPEYCYATVGGGRQEYQRVVIRIYLIGLYPLIFQGVMLLFINSQDWLSFSVPGLR